MVLQLIETSYFWRFSSNNTLRFAVSTWYMSKPDVFGVLPLFFLHVRHATYKKLLILGIPLHLVIFQFRYILKLR